jgi:hypothetical protein
MNRYDLAIDDPGGDGAQLSVTRSGDIALTASVPSVLQRALLAAANAPGDLVHRPNFGAGVERFAGLRAALAGAKFAAAWRASIAADVRVTSVRVESVASQTSPGRVDVTAVIGTAADIPATITYEV